ncbi:MAG: hypothetical protein ABIK07_00815 [Planctomycetota bacterium]
MNPDDAQILTINGGSSSIKFALFKADGSLQRILEGAIERIGFPEVALRVLLFMTLAILSFNFYPLTAVMSVMLALLNARQSCRLLMATCIPRTNPRPGTSSWYWGSPPCWALFVWGYALAWFVVTDRVKLLAYRVFDTAAARLLGKNSDGVSR